MKILPGLVAALLAFTGAAAAPCTRDLAVYYPSWARWIPFGPDQIDWERVSLVHHAFLGISSSATPVEDADFAATRPPLLVAAAGQGKPVLAAIGGWAGCTGKHLQSIAANPVLRETLASNLVAYCLEHGYSGIALDWEFPGMLYGPQPACTPLGRDVTTCLADRQHLTQLSAAIRARFDEVDPSLRMHLTLPISDWFGSCYDGAALDDHYSRLEVMAYDLHGNWTGHAGHNAQVFEPPSDPHGGVLSVAAALDYWILERGVEAERLLLGVPFYGYEYPAACGIGDNAVNGFAYRPYREIVANYLDQGWTREFDEAAQVPFLLRDATCGFISYDDTQSMEAKAELLIDRSIAGAMVWEISQDHDAANASHPLLEALASAICPVDPDCDDPQGDCDGDGTLNGDDCAPLEAGAQATPVEVQQLEASRTAGVTRWTWIDQSDVAGSATTYDVVAGALGSLPSGASAQCLGSSIVDAEFIDPDGPTHQSFVLVRARNLCGTGSFGQPSIDRASTCP